MFESDNFQFKHRGSGMVNVYDCDGVEVARVQTMKGKVTNITLKRRGLNKGLLFEESSRYTREVLGDTPLIGKQGGHTMPTAKKKATKKVAKKKTAKTAKTSKVAKKGATVAKATKSTKKAPPKRDGMRDFPASLDAWIKKCGKGKCMCGCGGDVKKRFLPGHDSKLKSLLKAYSTDNAKNIADELDWLGVVKWIK